MITARSQKTNEMRSITNEELITHIENRGRKIRSEIKRNVDNLKNL